MIITIIVLVVMTLAGVALVRSVDTTNLIAGNLAFHESTVHSGDGGIEIATKWLQDNAVGGVLNGDDSTAGYSANGMNAARSPAAGQSWDAYWTATLASRSKDLGSNGVGNRVEYAIDRICAAAGAPTLGGTCATSLLVNQGYSEMVANKPPLDSLSMVYYRITVKISGPRNTVSYVQAIVAL